MKKILLSFFAAVSMLPGAANAGVPLSFTHQGLLKEDGAPVNANRQMKAEIVNEKGQIIGEAHGDTPIVQGLYNLTIENIDSMQVAAAEKLLLKISVEGEELSPALTINSVPYAMVSRTAMGLNTAANSSAAVFGYTKDGAVLTAEPENMIKCPCDNNNNANECGESFTHQSFDVAGCYDVLGGTYYQYYSQDQSIRPLDVVAIEAASVGIGTAQPDAPLHILSDVGESDNGYAVHIADSTPRILLEDLDGTAVTVAADNGQLKVVGIIDADDLGEKLLQKMLNRMYPVGSIFTSTTLATAEQVHDSLGGTWEAYGQGRVLVGVGNNGDGTEFSVNAFGGSQSESYTPTGSVQDHTLTISEIPSHNHSASISASVQRGNSICGSTGNCNPTSGLQKWSGPGPETFSVSISSSIGSTGGSAAHNHPFAGSATTISHMQPYQVVYMWKRIN